MGFHILAGFSAQSYQKYMPTYNPKIFLDVKVANLVQIGWLKPVEFSLQAGGIAIND